ncbi:hypothetical protein [Spirochaeta cellobiosiphila]|uniref:hypothetical protein n=1 Tax=Spirochaeta cellobiosiphila TaxID=504483 RepID=UPI00040C78F8|nr:hypothetical protein [Spirochaeta cellobiosiphila]
MTKTHIPFVIILGVVTLLVACQSDDYTNKWQHPQGKQSLNLVVDADHKAQLELAVPFEAIIQGEAFKENEDNWIFYIDNMKLLFSWRQGWTDALLNMEGVLKLVKEDTGYWTLNVVEEPLLRGVAEAQVRLKRDRYYGDQARDIVTRRFNRVQALVSVLPDQFLDSYYVYNDKKKGYYSSVFFKDLEKFLFPELHGYLEDYPKPDSQLSPGERYIHKEEFKWDGAYTQKYFPEIFWDIRNSGTLYRDYEEGYALIFLFARWDSLWNTDIPQILLQEL